MTMHNTGAEPVFICLLAVVLTLSGCVPAYWLRDSNGLNPTLLSDDNPLSEDDSNDGWQTADFPENAYELAVANDLTGLDWPLIVAVHEFSGWVDATDCRSQRDPFRCLLEASARRKPAFAYRTRWGTDSMYGWAATVSGSGELTMLYYDSSPCGQISPGACGFVLTQNTCKDPAAITRAKIQRVLCRRPHYALPARMRGQR